MAMKTSFAFLTAATAALLSSVILSAADAVQPGQAKGPVSKLYVAEVKGEGQVQTKDKVFVPQQATAFNAPGTVIETKEKSHNALVYSNGTGLFVDQSTRVEIVDFTQAPFATPAESTEENASEPSLSQSNVRVPHGAVGICTSRLLTGSAMTYSTPTALINIRGGRLSIESLADRTIVDLLEGDITVRALTNDPAGQKVRAGERAIIRNTASAGGEPLVTIEQIPQESLPVDERRTEIACTSRRSVTFEVIGRRPGQNALAGSEIAAIPTDGNEAAGAEAEQIAARPTVPQNPPSNIVVSPDRLPGT